MPAEAQGTQRPLFLLDAMSLAFRAFFALPDDLTTSSGAVTNALHGFVAMLVNIVRDHRPGSLAVAFDLPGDTFRHELVVDYKGGRAATPDILLPQFDMIRSVLSALEVPIVERGRFEADDVLATLATQARDRGCDAVVVTGDRDCFQLVEDPHIRVLYNRRGVSDYSLYDEAGIVERTGVSPSLYPMLAAMRGDPSDNLPGVPGVGEKTAAKLLGSYGGLDAIYAHLDELTPKLRENLAAHEAQVRANASVIPLVRDVPLDVSVESLNLGGWDLATVKEVFERFELRTLWRRTVPLLAEGLFGEPAAGSERPAVDNEPEGTTGAGRTSPARVGAQAEGEEGGAPDAQGAGHVGGARLTPAPIDPAVPASPAEAIAALSAIGARWWPGGATTPGADGALSDGALSDAVMAGAVLAVAGRWDGLPGRGPLRGLVVVAPALQSPALQSPAPQSPAPQSEMPGAAVWLLPAMLEDSAVAAAVTDLLTRAPVVGHGVKEILRSLLPLGMDCRGLVMDAEVASYLIDPSTGDYGLDTLGTGQLSIGEAGGAEDAGETDQRVVDARAAADAALAVAAAGPALWARLDAEGLRSLHDEVELPLIRVLARMEVTGIRVDVDELRRITGELASEVKTLVEEIHTLAGHEFNVNSTPQLRAVLYTELGLAPGRKTKTGYSTDASTLETLRERHAIVDRILRYRELEKLRSTYGETLLAEVAPDQRIHASFRQTVARTGRLSSERPNLHNIPTRRESGSQFRRAFVPAEGCRFLVADYDQVELRVIAHLSGDPGLIAAFSSGQDIHRTVASGVYGVPPEEVTKDQRDRAKMVSYGLAYGMEAFGLARRLSSGVDEANEIMERYFRAFPGVRAYMVATVEEARARGFTRTQMGRKRPLPELRERNYQRRAAAERQAMNAGIQGLAADLFKVALVRLDHALERERMASRLVLQVHDEVLVEAVPQEEAAVFELTKDALCHAVELSVPLEVTMSWGDSWGAKGGS